MGGYSIFQTLTKNGGTVKSEAVYSLIVVAK